MNNVWCIKGANYHVYGAAKIRNRPEDQRYWGQMRPASTYFPITALHQLFSFLSCFSLQPFNHGLLLLSTCHLDDIVLYLWERLVSNPQGSQWLSVPSPSDRYFHLEGLTIMLLFEHRATDGADSTSPVKQPYMPQRALHMWWCLHYHGNALCLTNKNYYYVGGGFQKFR